MASKENKDELSLDDNLLDVAEALSDIKTKWFHIGVQLRVPISDLKEIEHEHSKDLSKALLEMLIKWFKRVGIPHTWAAIVDVLKRKSVDECVSAAIIEEKYVNTNKSLAAIARSVSEPCKHGFGDMKDNLVERTKSDDVTADQDSDLKVHASVSQVKDAKPLSNQLERDSSRALPGESSENFLYPFLDTSSMSEDEKQALQGRLTNECIEMSSKYSTLYRGIFSSLTKRGVTPKELAGVLMGLNTFSLREKEFASNRSLLEHCLDDIEKAEDNQNVFKLLLPYGSFIDCHVLKHIVDSDLCTQDERQKMQKYSKELDEYCKRNMYECPHFSSLHPEFTRFIMKVDEDVTKIYTVKSLQAFRDQVARALSLKGHTLRICSVEEGCLQLTCQMPSFIREMIFPLTLQQKEKLQSLRVLKITCNDEVCFIAQNPATTSTPLTLALSQKVPTDQHEGMMPTGRLGKGRYCYIHKDGVTQRKGFFEFQQTECGDSSKLRTIKVKLPDEQEKFRSSGLLCKIDSDSGFEQARQYTRQQSLYYIGENQERALGRPLLTFLMDDYISHIQKKLKDSLTWMYKQGLKPKLEGRFGKLCWRKVAEDELSTDMCPTEKFAKQAFESASSYFYTRIDKESSAALVKNCSDVIDEIETYDFKLKTAQGKLDVRVKFDDCGKPEVLAVKKMEYKVAIFDILCLNRKYDMRVSLNNYEGTSEEHPIVKKFLSTLTMTAPRTISFVSKASKEEWIVDLIRHKEIHTHFYRQPQFVVTISTVRQFEVENKDAHSETESGCSDTETVSSVCVDSKPSHSEIELHNLSWDVSFGHLLGLKPEQSLVLFMKPENIPRESLEAIRSAPKQWEPEWVMEDFVKYGFMNMLEDMNKTMDCESAN